MKISKYFQIAFIITLIGVLSLGVFISCNKSNATTIPNAEYKAKLSEIENDSTFDPEDYKSGKEVVERLAYQIKYKTTSGISNMSDWDGRTLTQVLNNILKVMGKVISINDVTGAITFTSKSGNVLFEIDKDNHVIDLDIKAVVPDKLVKTLNTLSNDVVLVSDDNSVTITPNSETGKIDLKATTTPPKEFVKKLNNLTGEINIASKDNSVDITIDNNNIDLAAKSGIQQIGKATAKVITLYADTSINLTKFEWVTTEDGKVMLKIPLVDPKNNPMAEHGFVTKEQVTDWNTRVTQHEKAEMEGEISENRLEIKNKIEDAPVNTTTYARKGGKWLDISATFNSITEYVQKVTGISFGENPEKTIKTIISELNNKQNRLPLNDDDRFFVNGKGMMSIPQGDDHLLRNEMGKLKTGKAEDWNHTVKGNYAELVTTFERRIPFCTIDNGYLSADKDDKNHKWKVFPKFIKSLNGDTSAEQKIIVHNWAGTEDYEVPTLVDDPNGYHHLYITNINNSKTKIGMVYPQTITDITGEEKVITKPSISLKEAKARIDLNSQLLHNNIIDSDTISVEKIDGGKVKLHASVDANRGLTKIYYKELKNIEAYTSQPYKFTIQLDENIDNLFGVEAKGLRKTEKKIEKVLTFKASEASKFYPSNKLVFDGNLHTKNSIDYSMDTSTKDKGWIATPKFTYTKSAKSALSPSNAYALQWCNNDYDSKMHKDSTMSPFKNLVKHGTVGVHSYWQTANERTHVTKLYKRSWFHFFIYPRVFVGDFSHAFRNIKIHPTKSQHVTQAWDTKNKKSWDGAYAYYVEAGIANMDKGMLQFDNDDSCMVTIGCPEDDSGKPVCFNPYNDMTGNRFPIGTNSEKVTHNISILFQRTGGVLSAYGIVMKPNKFWNGKLDDPNIAKTYNLYEKTYTQPIQLYFTLDSLNLNKDDTDAYMEWNYRGPNCDDPMNFNGIENIYIIDNKVRSLEGPPYYLAHRGEDWEGMTDKQKADVLKFTHTEVPNYEEMQKLFGTGTYQIVTFPNHIHQKITATCPYIGDTLVFMKDPISLSKLGGIDIDGIDIHCKTMTSNNNPNNVKIGSNQIKIVISFDNAKTWHTWNTNVKEWDPIHIQDISNPTYDDIVNVKEHGISLDALKEINWNAKPYHARKLDKIRLGIYINNTSANDMVYINSIDFTVVEARKWEEFYGNNDEYKHYIDYENMCIDFEVHSSFEKLKIFMSIFNPDIIHKVTTVSYNDKKLSNDKKIESLKDGNDKKIVSLKDVNDKESMLPYVLYFIGGIILIILFGSSIIYKSKNNNSKQTKKD